jgi:hypothetical protein
VRAIEFQIAHNGIESQILSGKGWLLQNSMPVFECTGGAFVLHCSSVTTPKCVLSGRTLKGNPHLVQALKLTP